MLIQGTLDESNNVIIPSKPLVWVGDIDGGGGSGVVKIDPTQNTVKLDNAAPISVSGPLTNAQLTAISGTAAQTTVTTNPTAAGQTMLAVLRGILAEMQAQTVLLNDIKTNTTP